MTPARPEQHLPPEVMSFFASLSPDEIRTWVRLARDVNAAARVARVFWRIFLAFGAVTAAVWAALQVWDRLHGHH
jgi:hypothetical protein